MLRILVVAFLLSLSGCAGFMQPSAGMDAQQIAAAVKDKNGSVICISAIGPYGTYTLTAINLDQNVVKDGGLSVTDGCKSVAITTQAHDKPSPTVTPKPVTP